MFEFIHTTSAWITWTIIHFLWLGAATSLTIAAVQSLVTKQPTTQYRYNLIGLAVLVVCFPIAGSFATWTIQFENGSAPMAWNSDVATGSFENEIETGPDHLHTLAGLSNIPGSDSLVAPNTADTLNVSFNSEFQSKVRNFSPLVATLYLFGATLMLARLMTMFVGCRRIKHQAVCNSGQLVDTLQTLTHQTGLRVAPAVRFTDRVATPMVAGILKPILLVPPSLLTNLSAAELEAVLVHELAHLKRYDHVVVLLQRVAEAILFFHPAVWFFSRELSRTRELCCDDLVLKRGTCPLVYARSLCQVAEDSNQHVFDSLAVAATGEGSRELLLRVRRVLGEPANTKFGPSRIAIATTTFLILVPVLMATKYFPSSSLAANVQPVSEAKFQDEDHPYQKTTVDDKGKFKIEIDMKVQHDSDDGIPSVVEQEPVDAKSPAKELLERANSALASGNFDQAIENFEKAKRRAPGDPAILNNLAYTHLLSNKPDSANKALALVDQAIEQLKNLDAETQKATRIHFAETRGVALMKLNRYEESAEELEAFLKARPGNERTLKRLIKVYDAMFDEVLSGPPSKDAEKQMAMLIEKSSLKRVQGTMIQRNIDYIKSMKQLKAFAARTPEFATQAGSVMNDFLNNYDYEKAEIDRQSLLERLSTDFADVPSGFVNQTFGQRANRELYEIQNLSVGKPALEISGQDLNGKELKLSEYRGKVVLLFFWGDWAPPAQRMYDHLRSFEKKLGGKPFAIVGLNSDDNRELAKTVVQQQKFKWRNFWLDGKQSPIAKQWQVTSWPTTYVLDSKGIIRYKQVQRTDLDAAITTLMAEVGHDVDLAN